jgi:hypothetical protein
MFYFSTHPLVEYDPTNENAPQLCVDITKRFKLSDIAKKSKLIYYNYQVKDRDRPDILAESYYGDSRLDWVVFITNMMYDPYFQWPLNQFQFDSFIREKYGSVSNATSQIHHYEQIITPRREYVSNYDGTTIVIPEKTLVVDQTTYVSLGVNSKKIVYSYGYEETLNNKKRSIKIMDKTYLPQLIQEFKDVFSV